jgi:hypothetical protein
MSTKLIVTSKEQFRREMISQIEEELVGCIDTNELGVHVYDGPDRITSEPRDFLIDPSHIDAPEKIRACIRSNGIKGWITFNLDPMVSATDGLELTYIVDETSFEFDGKLTQED